MTERAALPAAVLWDMDGTLVDSEPYWIAEEYALVESFGGQWSDEHAHQLVGQALLWSGVIWIDQTAPVLSDVKRQVTGRVTTLTGSAHDVNGRPLTLRLKGSGGEVTRTVQANATFHLLLPTELSRGTLDLQLTDAAGNGAHAVLD